MARKTPGVDYLATAHFIQWERGGIWKVCDDQGEVLCHLTGRGAINLARQYRVKFDGRRRQPLYLKRTKVVKAQRLLKTKVGTAYEALKKRR